MNDPKCPYCGGAMTVKSTFFDRYSGKYSAHAKCWECGSQGPVVKSSTEQGAINRAMKHALKRPQRRPLMWSQIEAYLVVYLEDKGVSDLLPAFPEPVKDRGVMCFLTAAQEFVTADKADYGKRWRAWAAQPTKEERNAVKWM